MNDLWALVYLGFGSSLAPETNIKTGISLLQASPEVEITGISTFYRTPPLPAPGASSSSVSGDPDFLNGVVALRTGLAPGELADLLFTIEERAGRIRTENAYAPRTLDMDILLYLPSDQAQASGETPPPPHRDIRTRAWVALPLFELNSRLLLPPEGTPLAQVVKGFRGRVGEPEPKLSEELRTLFL